MSRSFHPLRSLLPPALIPAGLFEIANRDVLDLIGVSNYEIGHTINQVRISADLAVDPDADGDPELELALPAFPELALILTSLGHIDVQVDTALLVSVSLGGFRIRLPLAILEPVIENADGGWERDLARDFVEIDLAYATADGVTDPHPIKLTINERGAFGLELPFTSSGGAIARPVASLNGYARIAGTGIVIGVTRLSFDLNPDDPWIGFDEAELILPPALVQSIALPKISLSDGKLSKRGVSGTATATWPLEFASGKFVYQLPPAEDAAIFGLSGGLRSIAVSLVDNQLTAFDISGGLVVPYFDEPVDITLDIEPSGLPRVTLTSPGAEGIVLRKDDLLALTVKSLSVGQGDGDVAEVVVTGGLEPLLMASDGLEWPRLDVTDLAIDTRGRFRIKEAWLDLKELSTLDLFGFHFELNRIGLGYQETDDKLWLDLTGSVKLIEQIPVGLGVEGFRLTWPRTLFEQLSINGAPSLEDAIKIAGSLEVKFDGVYLFYGVPGAVEFEGLIRFIKSAQVVAFAGDMALRVPATGLSAEAGLMIGMNLADPPYPFLYLYFGIELPAGIPLAQSGLALKGALGLFGINVAPAKAPEENWYYDWYKRGPVVGAHPTNKWTNQRDALAIGIGVTITTVDGYVKGVRGLIVLALPGPLLIIEGRALILSGLTPAEPPLRALAVLDGREQTIQFNVEAEAELVEDMLDAYGMLEAFFDFKDLTNFHLYLGQEDPRERRIQANVFKFGDGFLFKADAYLMIDTVGARTLRSRMGVYVGFKPPIPDIGPVSVTFDAVIEGRGEVTLLPEQFSGELDLSATIKLEALGTGIQLAAAAGVETEGPKPLSVGADISVSAEMPAGLDPIEATFEFKWEMPEPPAIAPPLTMAAAGSPFATGGPPLVIHERPSIDAADDWRLAATQSAIAPLDVRPIVGFGHEMNDKARSAGGAAFGRHPGSDVKSFDAGWMRFTPSVLSVKLYEHRKDQPWPATLDGWKLIASSVEADVRGGLERLPGVWMTEADPQDPTTPTTRRLQLWSNNPLLHAAAALGPGYGIALINQEGLAPSHAEQLLELHPALMECTRREPHRICVKFDDRQGEHFARGVSWPQHGLRLTALDADLSAQRRTRAPQVCLTGSGRLAIRFPEAVSDVRIHFCVTPKAPGADLTAHARTARPVRTPAEVVRVVEAARGKGERVPDPDDCVVPVTNHLVAVDDVWTIHAGEGFECLQLFTTQPFAIDEICYTTVAEIETAARITDQCTVNDQADDEPTHLLRPGSYYRLEVQSQLTGELAGRGGLEGLYRLILQALGFGAPQSFVQTMFFQTDGPPSDLAAYLKWTSPVKSGRNFRRDHLSMRFKRPNIQKLFGNPPHRLEILVRNAQGRLLDGYRTSWAKAKSASLLLEENVWREHRADVGLGNDTPDKDDVIVGECAGEGLEPAARYDMWLCGGEGGALVFHDDFAALSPDAWSGDLSGWTVEERALSRSHASASNVVIAADALTDIDIVTEIRLANRRAGGVIMRAVATPIAGAAPQWHAARVTLAQPQPGRIAFTLEALSGDPARPADQIVTPLADRVISVAAGLWNRLRISLVANRLGVWLFDELVFEGQLYRVIADWTPQARPNGTLAWYPNAPAGPDRAAIDRGDLLPSVGGAAGIYAAGTGPQFRRLSIRDAVLHRVSFTSSSFDGFKELVESAEAVEPIDTTAVMPSATERAGALAASNALAQEESAWHRAEIDFADETLRGGREALERTKLTLRDARAAHDAAFRVLADAVSADLHLAPVAAHLEQHVLRDAAGRVFGVWLRSPESLDLQRAVAGATASLDHTGRTTIDVTRGSAIPIDAFHDAESTQVILLRRDGAAWSSGVYRVALNYHRDHGDQLTGDHRYDRPVERGPGGDILTATLTFFV